ncbi:MAG: outer membrane lipoprotein-sorting protein [Proteobacteria bacterium]|nr:MAG: outer membrane lipoprotein-sorting protein [Pseudomonadota bacterium]PIE64157.1 MAG: outer membrane lipoprotein-sorting protein [Desulfobacterales bacterium]
MRNIFFFTIFVSLCFPSERAWSTPSGRDIMVQVDAVDTSKDSSLEASMVIERGKKKLIRKLEIFSRKYGKEGKDQRTLIRFLEPADVRGTMYLTWAWDDSTKDDDMWVYLPAESLVRRISGGGKKGSFMRSDLANEDIEDRAVDDDMHTLKGTENLNGAECWVVESVPRPELKKDTNYSKRIIHVRKDILLPTRIDYYDKGGRLLKTATLGGFKQIDGIWTTTRVIFETPARKTRTLMERSAIHYNQGLDEELFLQNNLKR